MYLSKLEIFGFKSFPEKTVIEFGNGVSAIVGPNGSGKSNIVDAIRWVLGEQGDKALRSEKREDVVFSGTSKRKPLSIAEVSLTIQNNKNILPTEYSEVQIARRFFRNGDTEYYLNGTKVRLKDIKNLFLDTGIGPDAYSVIELKMIETILSHVKSERRKMFEEAAGIVSYKQNRDLTYKRLESVHETLLRVNDIIREKQRNLGTLERQAKKNEEARILSSQLKLLEICVSSYEYDLYLKEISEIKDHESENIELKQKLSSEIDENNAKSDLLNQEIELIEKETDKLNNELKVINSKIDSLERENLVLEQKYDSTEKNIKRLIDENSKLDISLKKIKAKHLDTLNKIKVLKQTLEASAQSLKEKKNNSDEARKELNKKSIEIAGAGNKLRDTNKDFTAKKNEFERNKIILDSNLDTLTQISKQNQDLIKEISKLNFEIEDIDNRIKICTENKKIINVDLNNYNSKRQLLQDQINNIEKSLNKSELDLNIIENKIQNVIDLTENLGDFSEGVKYLLKDKNNKFLLKTLLDIIEVDNRFKIAVETALGEITNYLILENSSNLAEIINELESGDKGKVTFILNDKFNFDFIYPYYPGYSDQHEDFKDDKGVYGFASDLVRIKDKNFTNLIKYLLDEYVIVNNLETAFRLSSDNYYKFITLDGDIITESVVRAGGITNEETLKLGRDKLLEKYYDESKTLKNKLEKDKLILSKLYDDYNTDEAEIFAKKISDIETEINNLLRDKEIRKYNIERIENEIKINEQKDIRIKQVNKKLNSTIDLLISEITEIENSQINLENHIAKLTEDFKESENNFSVCNAEYNNYSLECAKIESELKNEEETVIRLLNTIEHQESQLTKNATDLEEENKFLSELKKSIENNNVTLSQNFVLRDEIYSKYINSKKNLEESRFSKQQIDNSLREKSSLYNKVSQKLIDSQIKIRENEMRSEQEKDYIFKKYEILIDNIPNGLMVSINDIKNKYLDENNEFSVSDAKKDINDITEKLKRLGGGFQQIIWEEFQNEKEELEKKIHQRNDLIESEKDIKKTIEKINNEARDRFLKTFEEIRNNFIRIFKELFQEGDEANLKLVYTEDENGNIETDPLEAKIEITAKPRGKRPTSIELLSGGEKTLTAIALLFAIYLVKPSPFCILDEVDAPLDVANLARFNKMIRKFSEKTQFILITHNERTMEAVDTIYGVTMQEPGVTTIVETRFKSQTLQAI